MSRLTPEQLARIRARHEASERAGICVDAGESIRDVGRLLRHIDASEAQPSLFTANSGDFGVHKAQTGERGPV